MNVLANEATNETVVSFPPNIKTLIELPGEKDSIEIFLPEKTDSYEFFNRLGIYSEEYEKPSYFYSAHKYAILKPYIESIKPVKDGSMLKLNIKTAAYNDLNVTNEKGSYTVSYDYAYGYVIKVKLNIKVQSEFDFNYANGDMSKNDKNITKTQKDYIKKTFRKELVALGYTEDKPFLSFLADENLDRNVYNKDKSIVKVLDEGDNKYSNSITVYFEDKDINDNLNTIQNIKNDKKFTELQSMFK